MVKDIAVFWFTEVTTKVLWLVAGRQIADISFT